MSRPTLSMVAFGLPSDARTFSGYARALLLALRSEGMLRQEYSVKPQHWLDVLRSTTLVTASPRRLRPHISRRWMWSHRGVKVMSQQLDAEIRTRGDIGAFLQVGTLVPIDPVHGPHYMLTDMTIPQACRAGHFAVSHLSKAQLAEAEEVQLARLREARHVFALCQWTVDSLTQDFGVPPDRVSIVYAGSNLHLPEAVVEPKRPRDILFVGIDWERKGGPLLLEAFQRVRERLPDVTLTIVGCTPKVRQPGINVEGFLSRSDPSQFERLARCYLGASCFCLPTMFDPFPNVIIEAASAGLPAVCIDSGSRREAILDGITGKLASAPEPGALADALFHVLRDPDRLSAMGAMAKRFALKHFTWHRVLARIEAVLRMTAGTQENTAGATDNP